MRAHTHTQCTKSTLGNITSLFHSIIISQSIILVLLISR